MWLPLPLRAQDTLRLAEAVVVADEVRSRDLVPVQQLSDADLDALRAHSVADAVRFFSGAQLKDYGGVGGLKTVNVRGMGTQHVGVVLDGVALTNAQNGTVDLGRFALDDMQAVTLYNGQRTTLLQPAQDFASASAIYLESRTPDFARPLRLCATVRGGSFGTFQSGFSLDRRLSPRLAATLSASYQHSDAGYRYRYRVEGGYDTTARRRGSDIDALRLEGGLYGRSACDDWRLRAYLYASERGLPGAVVRGRNGSADRQWDTDLFLQTSWRRSVTSAYTHLLTAKAAYDRLRYTTDPVADPAAMYADNIYRRAELYLSSAHQVTLRGLSLAAAADYRLDRLLANLYAFPTPTRHTALASLAAQARWGGLRAQADLLGTFVYDHTHRGAAMRRRGELSPSLVLAWQPSDTSPLTLRAFAKRIFRMPTLTDLYYTLVGTSDLRPERTVQFDAGATLALRPNGVFAGGELSADVYHNTVRDKIVAIPSTSMFRWTMLNLGRVRIEGLDVTAQTLWGVGTVRLNLRATYTYERARDVTDRSDAFYGDQIPYIPRHSGSATARLEWHRVRLAYSFIYTGQRYDQRANLPENFAPAWYTSDLSLAYTLGPLELHGELNNLFNQQYEIVKGYPLPGRHFLVGLTWRH